MNRAGPAAVAVKRTRPPEVFPSRRTAAFFFVAAVLLASEGASGAPAGGGDAPRVASIRRASAVLDDGRELELDGGVWLSTDTAIARARDLERLAVENAELRRAPPPPPPPLVTFVVLLAVGLGVGVGYLLPRP